MHRASDRVEHQVWLDELRDAADELDLSDEAASTAGELFLGGVPDSDRSKPAAIGAALYAATRLTGESRSQSRVAEAVGISRLALQRRWKPLLESAGFESPGW